ncbi:MAG: lysylphosphatidylglycerol synthase transmembrane domain-containing protein [Planctomycetota bacterium]
MAARVERNLLKQAVFVLKLLISAGLLGFLAWRAAREEQFQGIFAGRDYAWFAAAVAVGLLATLVTFFRWYLLARALGLAMRLGETIRVSFIAVFIGLFAFGTLGTDSARAFTAARNSPGKRVEAVASVFVDRLIGLLTMFLLAAGGYYIQSADRWQQLSSPEAKGIQYVVQVSGWAAAAILFGGGVALAAPQILQWSLFERLRTWPVVGQILTRVMEIVRLYRSQPGVLLIGMLLSVGSTLLFALSIYLLAVFYGGNHPSLADHCIIAPISLVANAVPLPGGLGGMETMLDFLYREFTSSQGDPPRGIAVAFAFRFVFLLMAGIGAIVWFAMGKQERESLQSGDLP